MQISKTEEEFYIDFMIRGRNYTGLVAANNRNGLSTFIVRYSMEPACLIETTLELCPVVVEEADPLEWHEIPDMNGKKLNDLSLIKIIGDALEERDI